MNIARYDDGTSKLTPSGNGKIRNLLNCREYPEVKCDTKDEHLFMEVDSEQATTVTHIPGEVTYSKLKIVSALMQLGVWESVWSALTPQQQTLWENAVNFSSAYPAFTDGINAFRQMLPGVDVDALLRQCVAE